MRSAMEGAASWQLTKVNQLANSRIYEVLQRLFRGKDSQIVSALFLVMMSLFLTFMRFA